MGGIGKGRLALGVVLVTLVAIAIGYVIASAVVTFRDLGFRAEIDFFYIAQNYRAIGAVRPDDFRLINLIMGGAGVAGLMMSLAMSVKSVITAPSGQQVIAPGPRQIEGLAWSGRGRIARVELSIDDGRTWTEARLQAPVQPKALTRFSLPWDWHNERAILMSRATDETGDMQPTRDIWHDTFAGHSFNHFNAIQAWSINRSGEVKNHYA